MATEMTPTAIMQQMLSGFEVSQALFALTAADVPTVLHRAGPLAIADLAGRTGTDPDALARIIRSLVPLGVFTVDNGRVGLTELSAALSADDPHSLRGIAMGLKTLHYQPFGELEHTLRTGETAATRYYGMPYFDWIAGDPARTAIFTEAMVTFMATLREGMLDGFVLPPGEVVADIGGGNGEILTRLLNAAADKRRGILLDLPSALDAAHPVIAEAGLTDRVEVVAGDFFASVPAADIYVLSWILHDWDDDDARRILDGIARAGTPGARLLVLESVMPDGDEPHPSKAVDLTMLAILGGRERTESEYRALLGGSGFAVDRIVATPTPFAVLEATLGGR